VRRFTYLIPFSADYDSEKLLKKLMGRIDIEDALLRLDLLTKEESLMALAKNLEVTHHVKVLAEDIDDKVQRVDHNVKTTNERTRWFLSVFVQVPTLFPVLS